MVLNLVVNLVVKDALKPRLVLYFISLRWCCGSLTRKDSPSVVLVTVNSFRSIAATRTHGIPPMSLFKSFKRLKTRWKRGPLRLNPSRQASGEAAHVNNERRQLPQGGGEYLPGNTLQQTTSSCQTPTHERIARGQHDLEAETPTTTTRTVVKGQVEEIGINEIVHARTLPLPVERAIPGLTIPLASVENSIIDATTSRLPEDIRPSPTAVGDQHNIDEADMGGTLDVKSPVKFKFKFNVGALGGQLEVECEKEHIKLCFFTGDGGVSFSAPDFCEPLGMLLPGTMTA
ncbi:hypothetical protein SCHPADRAFT_936337 [Schizopora paradoxa]|uniref:Uncharacterized protein n=1 Tax=Schizopora paradoxa TaxID=27342 RepID=A0A0H2S2K4_9AGAM|nr:hypothetical protein SCHPADRAFT_936337 [Schizopora paradoxa]